MAQSAVALAQSQQPRQLPEPGESFNPAEQPAGETVRKR